MVEPPKKTLQAQGMAPLRFTVGAATFDTRYSFTAQFVRGAEMFARRAAEIEAGHAAAPATDALQAEHRAMVAAAIMQASAALESDVAEVLLHGPHYHRGGTEENRAAQARLQPFAELVDRQPLEKRHGLVLKLLGLPGETKGCEPFQSMKLAVSLRNELTHYKSLMSSERAQASLMRALEALRHAPPPFLPPGAAFFPFRCLSAARAAWAAATARETISRFHELLGSPSSPLW